MHDKNGKPFIATLYNVLFSPDLCNQLFSIITLMNLGHTCLFHKGFCKVLLSDTKYNVVILPHSAQRKHGFLVKTKEKSKSQKQIPKKKVSLELLHQIIGHISTRSLLDIYTANFGQVIEFRVDNEPFCTSCQIYTINKKGWFKDTSENQDTFHMGVHGYNTSHIFQKFNKRHYFWSLPLNFGCLFQNYKTLWNGKYHH